MKRGSYGELLHNSGHNCEWECCVVQKEIELEMRWTCKNHSAAKA